MSTSYPTVPAVYGGRAIAPRNIFKSGWPEFLPSLATIDGSKSRDTLSDTPGLLLAGLLMGKITATGKYRPSILGVVGANYTSGGTSVTVSAAVATEVARQIALTGGNVSLNAIGPPAAAGTVAVTAATVSAASGTTLTVSSLGVNKAAGSIITASDGSQNISQIMTQQYGVAVVDWAGAALDQTMRLVRGGDIDVTMIPYYASMDVSVQTYVKNQLKSYGLYTFSDDR